ncbi:MAG TPA: hypothetical protein VLX56_03460 [Nitrososphaerales archaeon]|nr:hypothetical protein [Nitrososphaerales archaeon]
MASSRTIAMVAAIIAVVAGASFYAGLASGGARTATQTTVSVSTLTVTPSSQSQASSTVTSTSTLYSTETTTMTSTLTSTETIALNSTSGQLGPWVSTTPYPGTYGPSSCMATADYLYCLGDGTNATYFAPISFGGIGQWTRSTDYPIPVVGEGCVGSSNYIYCLGGVSTAPAAMANDQYGRVASAYYATVSSSGIGEWKATTPFPYVLASTHCMAYSSSIYCIAPSFDGKGYSNPARTFFAPLLSIGIGNWNEGPGPVSEGAGCSGVGGYAYCYGGAPCSPNPPPSDCFSPSYSAPLSPNGVGIWNSSTQQLPTAVFDPYGSAESFIYYFSTPVFYAHVSGDSIGAWETTTNLPDGFVPTTCTSSGPRFYCVGPGDGGAYFALLGAPNPTAYVLENPPPFPKAEYIVRPSNYGCTGDNGETCFGNNIDDAVVFDCASSAARPSGCETLVVNPLNSMLSYNITIWYPAYNPPLPNANCEILPEFGGYNTPENAWCISISPTSFIVAEPIHMSPPQQVS